MDTVTEKAAAEHDRPPQSSDILAEDATSRPLENSASRPTAHKLGSRTPTQRKLNVSFRFGGGSRGCQIRRPFALGALAPVLPGWECSMFAT